MAKSSISDGLDIGKYCSKHNFSRLDVHYDLVIVFLKIFINTALKYCVLILC